AFLCGSDLEEASAVEEAPEEVDDEGASAEGSGRALVDEEVEVARPVARLHLSQRLCRSMKRRRRRRRRGRKRRKGRGKRRKRRKRIRITKRRRGRRGERARERERERENRGRRAREEENKI